MPAATIDEVILDLGDIITEETTGNSCLAFFPILYKTVTERIKIGIANNEFDDAARMEKLDVIFAGRYLEAYEQFTTDKIPSSSWLVSFKAKKPLVMQCLLLGINAHINLDLGIAAAETVGDNGQLADFEADFDKINAILADMVGDVKEKIGKVSPLFRLIDYFGKGKEDKLVSFSIEVARDGAWLFANEYHQAVDKMAVLKRRDDSISKLAENLIAPKSKLLRFLIKLVYFFELKDVKAISKILNQA